MIYELKHSKTICNFARPAINLFIEKWVCGLSLDQMAERFKLSRSSINSMLYAGEFYLAGYDKRLKLNKKFAFK